MERMAKSKESTKKVSVRLPESVYIRVRQKVAKDPKLTINDFLCGAICVALSPKAISR